MPYGAIISKRKIIIRNRIASVVYVATDESVNEILTECSKLVLKECKTRHNWVGKRLKLDR